MCDFVHTSADFIVIAYSKKNSSNLNWSIEFSLETSALNQKRADFLNMIHNSNY